MQQRSADRDFSSYNAAQAERPVRPLARAALAALRDRDGIGATASLTAIELGCGIGVEARFLAENGVRVHAYDADPSVAPALTALADELPVHPGIIDLAELTALPPADLVLSCATLSFVPQDAFDALWDLVTESLRPQGILAVDLFGDQDDWAGTEGTYLARHEVETLCAGLEVLELTEQRRDGRSFAGPKHWHTYQLLARRP